MENGSLTPTPTTPDSEIEVEKPPQPTAYARWEWITPKIAQQLLARASRQRRLVPALIRHYVRQRRDGQWLNNPELIMVNESGETIEGQHRLHAVVDSGVPGWMFVARDVEDDVFPVLNTGRSRGPRDVISVMYRDADEVALAAAVPMLVAYEREVVRLKIALKLTPYEQLAVIERHPAIALCTRHSKEIVRLLGKSAATFVRYLLSEIDQSAADEFYRQVETGDGARGSCRISPPKQQYAHIVKAALAIKAWNIDRAGRSVTASGLRWRSSEAFPKPIAMRHETQP